MGKAKIAVIGAGSIAQIGHLPYYRDHPDVDLVAVVDVNLERAQQVGAKFGANSAYADVKEMLQTEKPDAVSICTTNSTHVPLAMMAIEYGADVLVEKPLAIEPSEAWSLVEAARAKDRICMVGMTHRYRNEAAAVKRYVDAGELGDIYYAKAKILRRRGTPTGWFTDKSKSGGGPLMDIGVHVLDVAWWMLGQPAAKRISGQLVQGIGKYDTMASRWQSADEHNRDNSVFDVEDFASAYIRFENNLVLHLEVSWAVNGPQDDALKVDLFGTKAGISLDPLIFYSERNQIMLESKMSTVKNDPYQDEINHFVHCVVHHEQPISPVEQGARVVEMLNGIVRSSAEQREIEL
jgi:predicted dehydrogenase